jgi:Na+-transporting methylmalonyl-CoA/oxaloacetate decarboxylase gamma subunit
MTFYNGLLVSLFGMAVVFAALIALSFCISLESAVIGKITAWHGKKNNFQHSQESMEDRLHSRELMDSMSSDLKLVNVDDEEAAAITAAVTDAGRASGENLVVKSIKPIKF